MINATSILKEVNILIDNYNELEPKIVFKFFKEISKIPRCSGNERAISDYLVDFAKTRNLQVSQDESLNVLIEKHAYVGYENAPTVILQGHMDMVCDKGKDVKHDFKKDSIKFKIDGDMLYARGTTLGADNGIAMAYALAILDSKDIPHPPLKVLLTVEEEVGLNGAKALGYKFLEGDMLINIDSEEEGKLLTSCAGGLTTKHCLPIEWDNVKQDMIAYKISINGLKGGHSGVEIDKYRGNANKLMGRVLGTLSQEINFLINEINGGTKMNAIPREAEAIILIDSTKEDKLMEKLNEWNDIFKNELKISDPNVSIIANRLHINISRAFSNSTSKKAIALLTLIPNGVQTMSMDIKGLVESSTNLGVVTTTETEVIFESGIRSSIGSLKQNILNKNEVIADVLNIKLLTDSEYPEWEFNPNSKVRDIAIKVYIELFGVEPEITAVHGGLECGIFKQKNPNLDMISFGPNLFDVHTPNEHMSIYSSKRMWEYLLAILKEIK